MKHLISVLFAVFFILKGCVYADTDIEINTTINIQSEMHTDATFTVEICEELQLASPEAEEPEDKESGLLGKWDSCASHDECESGMCFCFMCVDIVDFLPN